MPIFFFDTSGADVFEDQVGSEFTSIYLARDAAIELLPDIAREKLFTQDSRGVVVLMRDASGCAVFTATLTITAKWLVDIA